MLKVRKRMNLSKLYSIGELRSVKCSYCIHYKILNLVGLTTCEFRRKLLDKDIALECPYFKNKGDKRDED